VAREPAQAIPDGRLLIPTLIAMCHLLTYTQALHVLIYVLLLLLLLLQPTAIELSLGGSSSYTSTDKTI